jgi:3-oxoacyl-[acyl-carrier-protein] synthase II
MKFVEAPMTSKAHGQPSVGVVRAAGARRVAVRAWGAVTVLGDWDATWAGLMSGACIEDHARYPADASSTESRAGALARRAVASLGAVALDADAAVVVGTSKGSIEGWLEGDVSATGLADVADSVSRQVGSRGPRLTVCAACASGLHALIRAAMMIRSGEARQALVVAAEASVHPLFLGSFQRLGVLAQPGDGCRPFDRNRTGFYMSEAAAAVLLEAEPDGDDCNSPPISVDRFALGADATHLTGGDPTMPALRHLLRRVVDGRPLDLVHAHGTGTPTNDESELAAIESTLVDQAIPPALYSHKGALGHSLGAAGLLSVVINCQSHATGLVPPNVRTLDPLPASRVSLSREAVRRPVGRSLAIAAGFGGALAVVALSNRG